MSRLDALVFKTRRVLVGEVVVFIVYYYFNCFVLSPTIQLVLLVDMETT